MNNVTTLKELGAALPLGTESNGKWHKDLAARRWTMKEERALGELKENTRNGQFVSVVLATMLTKFGSHNFGDSVSIDEKILHIGNASMADVLYAYVWLRVDALGPSLGLDMSCPSTKCKKNFSFNADLGSVEVKTANDLSEAVWTYDLKDPFVVRNKVIKGFKFGPTRWSAFDNITSVGVAKAELLLGSILEVIYEDDSVEPIVMVLSELDEMGKYDLEMISKQTDEHAIGPLMVVEGECPHCKTAFKRVINWSYNDFFGNSSL